MKNKLALFLICLLLTGQIMAKDYYPNNYTKAQRHGGKYIPERKTYVLWDIDQCGVMEVTGFNDDGTKWNSTIKPNGDMTGIDTKGHFWKYDRKEEMYYNFTTSESIYKGKK